MDIERERTTATRRRKIDKEERETKDKKLDRRCKRDIRGREKVSVTFGIYEKWEDAKGHLKKQITNRNNSRRTSKSLNYSP